MNHRLSTTLIGLLPSAVILAGAGLLAWSWRSELPDPVAVHFSADGPDGYGSLGGFIALMLGVCGAVAVGAWLVGVLLGKAAVTRRIAAGVAVGISGLGATILIGSLNATRGLDDAAHATGINGVIALALVIGLALGIGAAWVMPADRPYPASGAVRGPRLDLGDQERAVWSRQVTSPMALWLGGGATLLLVILTVVLRMPGLLAIVAILLFLLGSMTAFRVTVDTQGLRLRSALGWPRVEIPAAEITAVEVTQVRGMQEFGGFGIRVGRRGETGYVLRNGEGIRVHLTGGREVVVTVPDAHTGAALLATLAERSRNSTRPEA
ncbi:DUF1648 domain-containing protein [Cellulomonas sp. NPDC089187]|uniref:DUF1648 domain-containing protein n=1 Tax=Cellulomonas sp. NPDC089187 TaxID=3154970 RepID=UPI00341BF6AA